MNLYIPIEVKHREFQAKVFLAAQAARAGFDVIVGRKNDLNLFIQHMPPGVYLGLGAFENFQQLYAKLKKLGFLVVVNEEEGLVTYSDRMYVNMRVSSATLGFIDELFTWGRENRLVLSNAFPDFSRKFYVTGSPRFDLLKLENQAVYKREMESITSRYGRYVLVCTSFSSVNHFDQTLDYVKSLIDKKTLRSKDDVDNFTRYAGVKRQTLEHFLQAIPRLADANPNLNIIIRPHPSENHEVYHKCAKEFENVFVEARFSVHPWILRAEALVHHYCTTSIEAFAVGTPRFALRPIKDEYSEKEIPFGCSLVCSDVEQLVAHVTNCVTVGKQKWQSPEPSRDYSWYVSNIGDRSATSDIIARMLFLANASSLRSPKNMLVMSSIGQVTYMVGKMLRKLRHRGITQDYLNHKSSTFSTSEVTSLLRLFGVEGLKCDRVATDFIRIKRDEHGW